MTRTPKRLDAVDGQEDGADHCKRSRQPGAVTQGLGHAKHTGGNQGCIRHCAEQYDGSHVLAPQSLAQDEGILGADGNDESQAKDQPLDEDRKCERSGV